MPDRALPDNVTNDGVAPDGSTVVAGPSAGFPPPSAADAANPPDESATGVRPNDADLASSEPLATIVGVSFDRLVRAQEFLIAMGRLKQDGLLDLQDAVVVNKASDGKVRVTETIDPTVGRSALSGAVWTSLLGLFLGGPVGWIAGLGVGAGVGAVTAKVVDLGVPDEWVDWFKDAVRPGTSTVVLLADDLDVAALEAEARRFAGAELLTSTLPETTIDRLRAAFDS